MTNRKRTLVRMGMACVATAIIAVIACGNVSVKVSVDAAKPADAATTVELPAGTIVAFGGTVAPAGWLLCDGTAVSRTTYSDLFGAIATTYGTGDGSVTFNVPDLRGRAIVGAGTGTGLTARNLGDSFGEEKHTLTIAEMPSHFHAPAAGSRILSYNSGGSYGVVASPAVAVSNNDTNAETPSVGGSQPHSLMQPSLVTNYIIKS